MHTKTKNVYYCEFCSKKGMVKRIIEFHERYCTKNPAVTPKCFNCGHLTEDNFRVDVDPESDYVRDAKIFRCAAQYGKIVFVPTFVGKTIQHRQSTGYKRASTTEGFEVLLAKSSPMPIKCDKFVLTRDIYVCDADAAFLPEYNADSEYVEPSYPELTSGQV